MLFNLLIIFIITTGFFVYAILSLPILIFIGIITLADSRATFKLLSEKGDG
jgi:hypothetical protein